ncbi:MAG: M56 family metallopeptidase [Chitinophagaceae bacterium]|nr:M56 family metallopeptidase [Chitinophagaceae bacterium]
MTITLIKLLASSGILFAYYWLFLRNRKFHRYNRFYLLGAVLISMVLPFLKIDIFLSPTAPANKVILDTLEVITVNAGEEEVVLADAGTSWLDWFNSTNIMLSFYIIGAIVFLSLLIRSILYIRKIQHNYPVEKIEDLKFYNTAEPGTPFSFFRSIFWNNKVEFNSSEGQQIFRHELFHVRQKHSADLLFMELILLFAWFNPFFYLIKKELKAIHEFLADEYAVSNSDEYAYAELLVLFALHEKQNKLVHPFFHNTIKRRIAMITNLKNKKVGYWGRVMALPLSLLLFSFIVLKAQKSENPEDKSK